MEVLDDDENDDELKAVLAASKADAEAAATGKKPNAFDLLMAPKKKAAEGEGGEAGGSKEAAVEKTAEKTAGPERSSRSGGLDDGALAALVGSEKEAKNVFVELRKAANHPLLLREHFKDPAKIDRMKMVCLHKQWFGDQCTQEMVQKELESYCDLDLNQLCIDLKSPKLRDLELPAETLFESCKMEKLRTLVPQLIKENHRILIFSQWTKLLDIMEILMEHISVGWLRLDGQTPVADRQDLIDDFNSDPTKGVFLLSTRAGGMGINLTSADTVILHDLDFNPVSDRQAEDRCHRIGQTRPVTVYKLVTAGTVDARILEMGRRKNQVNSMLMGDQQQGGAGGGEDAISVSGMLKDALRLFIDDGGE